MPRTTLELYLTLEDAVRLESAMIGFDRLTAGEAPDRHELAAAPLLTHWRRTMVPVIEPALIGRVTDHPQLAGQRTAVTSRLLLLDQTGGWARTLSRIYRLGRPAD
ncbi:DUF6634 family protein [Methylobacterium sp. WL9]|uniref:DUF6634 family protein n=1 Tax=Methylobacterium sp. WL9 TaxID=2603898 RepID=UPI0011C6EB8C|nr:DUF6634 family protein [Methylobacterium sp. WL9]TXN22867.1 hypothetical protein FV217_09100 [Methylobacterium sp. WL9]